jgi:hypothetical protein
MSPSKRHLGVRHQVRREQELVAWMARHKLPPVTFAELLDVISPPPDTDVREGVFYRVMRGDTPKWALFLCPSGCRSVVTLSLQAVHVPHWTVQPSSNQRPSVRPSVWRDIGCYSHFFVEDGRVYWCMNSGSPPYDWHAGDR